MSGRRVGSGPMKAASWSSCTGSGSKGKQMRLVMCPKCAVRVIRIRSKQEDSYGQVFYKCPNNIKEDPRTCGFILSEEQYEAYLQDSEE